MFIDLIDEFLMVGYSPVIETDSELVPDLPDYIAEAKRIGYSYVYLTSNGSLATPEKAKAALDAGLDSIKFSINALHPVEKKPAKGPIGFRQRKRARERPRK